MPSRPELVAAEAISDALAGDVRPLVARLCDPDVTLTMHEREFLAGFIGGNLKRSANRQRSWRTDSRRKEVASFVLLRELKGESRAEAVEAAVEHFGRSERTVYADLKFARETENPIPLMDALFRARDRMKSSD